MSNIKIQTKIYLLVCIHLIKMFWCIAEPAGFTQLQEHVLSSPPGSWLHQLAFYVQELQLTAAVGLLLRCIISSSQVCSLTVLLLVCLFQCRKALCGGCGGDMHTSTGL